MKAAFFIALYYTLAYAAQAQQPACVFGPPVLTLDFGAGYDAPDLNRRDVPAYSRVGRSCPTDGHYAYTSYTEDCFRGDWLTIAEDHTPGDADGNMLLVNASYNSSVFFNTALEGLKGGKTYEFAVWMMNVCRISDKCPFPLLPNIIIRLKTFSGVTVAQFGTGELARRHAPHWTRYAARFTMPAGQTALTVTMQDEAPGGCGNDFALDDITLRECIPPPPPVTAAPKKTIPAKPVAAAPKPAAKKNATTTPPVKSTPPVGRVETRTTNVTTEKKPAPVRKQVVLAPPPPILTSRANPLVKQLVTGAGDIEVKLYDNGEIDGDTVSIYHNNELIVSRAKLSQKPITFRIAVNAANPHHELIMVANNLGSIPPNTSLMIVNTAAKRHQVFISSTEQKNAKVVFDLE